MSRRIEIELTSVREDGSWTWRAAGAREPRGTVEGSILPSDAHVGQVLRAEVEGHLDGLTVVSVAPPRAPKPKGNVLELKPVGSDQPLVTTTLTTRRSERRRGRDGRRGDRRRERQEARHERPQRPPRPKVEEKPRPKRLRAGKAHRTALLESVPAEQRPIVEQLLAGGIPAVRKALDKQNEELRAAGKPEIKADELLRVAEDLRPRALAAMWRDRAEAAIAIVDEIDLRDLRSVVNAADDAGRDEESRALAARLREALADRVEKEQAAWVAELAETVKAGRVVRALRLSSRPPKAGSPIPGDIANQLIDATAASLTSETSPERWATVLDALAYSPVRRRVIPHSLPPRLTPELRATIARLATRLPEIAHIFDIEPDPSAGRGERSAARRRGRKGEGRKGGDKADKGERSGRSDRSEGPAAAAGADDARGPEVAGTSDDAGGAAGEAAEGAGATGTAGAPTDNGTTDNGTDAGDGDPATAAAGGEDAAPDGPASVTGEEAPAEGADAASGPAA